MGSYFEKLPSEFPKWRIHEAVRDIFGAMQEDGGDLSTAAKLSRRIHTVIGVHVSADAIRFLMGQEKTDTSRINKSNVTLAAIYDFIVSYYHHFSGSTKERFHARIDDLCLNSGNNYANDHHTQLTDGRFAVGTQEWVNTSHTEVNRLGRKFQGRYALLRKSTISAGTIMRSTLDVRLVHFERIPYISVGHLYHDRSGRARSSKGFFFPVVKNVYGPLQVEDHEGLEVLVIRDPVQEKPGFLVGFMLGLNGDRTVYNSSVLLERVESSSTAGLLALPHRFSQETAGYDDLEPDLRDRLIGVLSEPKSRLISDLLS